MSPNPEDIVNAQIESSQKYGGHGLLEDLVEPVGDGGQAPSPQATEKDAAVQTSGVRVKDKRVKVSVQPKQKDVFQSLTDKIFAFVVEQPEFYTILQYPLPVRKQFGREVGKLISRFPHFKKAGFRDPA